MKKKSNTSNKDHFRFIDLFCGIGGFRIAAQNASEVLGLSSECVFSSDIDLDAQTAYEANFGERPFGDITSISASEIPDHDLLFGGFPCQAFSIIGDMKGFADARGTLFFDIARILDEKRPRSFVLENVKQLRGHDKGRTLSTILNILDELGYWVDFRVLNALDFGLPQKRERIVIVGFSDSAHKRFSWPSPNLIKHRSLEDVLEDDRNVDPSYFASKRIAASRKQAVEGKRLPAGRTIWHENKSGNISALPYSCALRAGASYNYLLVDGVRRLTTREMLRLQGFPDHFKIACGYSATRKQAGNSVPVPMIQAVIEQVLAALTGAVSNVDADVPSRVQPTLFSDRSAATG
jgi:DNA (cytosine-5)-methyltransferase 1